MPRKRLIRQQGGFDLGDRRPGLLTRDQKGGTQHDCIRTRTRSDGISSCLMASSAVVTLFLGPLRAITKVVVTQWSYAGLGSAIDMNGRIAADPNYSRVSRFGHHYFTLSRVSTYLILVAFIVGFLILVAWTLRRRARA